MVRDVGPDEITVSSGIETTTRKVSVQAQVKAADGQIAPRTIVFTLQRNGEARWLITGLR